MKIRISFFSLISLIVVSCKAYQYEIPKFSRMNTNEIEIKKVNNFRFIGGIKNKDGRILKDNTFYRSGNLHKLKKKSFQEFSKLGIQKVIDLRTNNEISKHQDQLPSSVNYQQLAAFTDKEDQMTQARKLVLQGKVNSKDAEKRMLDFYHDYPIENPEIIKEIIHQILDSDTPVLYHCTAGKDRTGMISMLLLTILNFDKETIYQDYLQSNNQRKKVIEKRLDLANSLHFIYPKMDIKVLEELSWIKPEFLDTAYQSIEKKYGSMDNYIRNVLKIPDEQQKLYIEKFTQ